MADQQVNIMKETSSILRDLKFKRFNVITEMRLRQSRKELSNMAHNSRVKGTNLNNVRELIEFVPVFFKNTTNKMNKYQLDFHLKRGSESLDIILAEMKRNVHFEKDSFDLSRPQSLNNARLSVILFEKGTHSESLLIKSSNSSPARSPVPNLQVNSGKRGHQNIAVPKVDAKKEQRYTKPFLQPVSEYNIRDWNQLANQTGSQGYFLKSDNVPEEPPVSSQRRHLPTANSGIQQSGRNVNPSSQHFKNGKQNGTTVIGRSDKVRPGSNVKRPPDGTEIHIHVTKDINANHILMTSTKVTDEKSKRPISNQEKPIRQEKTILNNQQEKKSDELSIDVMQEDSKNRPNSTPKSGCMSKTEDTATKDIDNINVNKEKQSTDTSTNIRENVVLPQNGNSVSRNDGDSSVKSENHHEIISDPSKVADKSGLDSNQDRHESVMNDVSMESRKEVRHIDVHLPIATSHSPTEGLSEATHMDDPKLVTQMSKTFYKPDQTSTHVDSHKAGTEHSDKSANDFENNKTDMQLKVKSTSAKRREGTDKQVQSPSPKQNKEKTNVSTSNGKNIKNDIRFRKSQKDVEEIPRPSKDVNPQERIEIKKLQETITSLTDENRKLKQMNDELLNRLSLITSEKLRDGNPNITDLGSNNRPSKLAEKLSELYDNEWTDAYQEISETVPSEEQRVHVLLEIIMISFKNCAKASKDQFETLSKSLRKEMFFPTGSVEDDEIGEEGRELLDSILFSLRDLRQRIAMVSVPKLAQMITTEFGKSFSPKCEPGTKIYVYAERCIELTWLMCIHDPPIYLYRCKPGTPHQDIFKAYKRSGTIVEFCVWPCAYLYEGGPLISKGVAEMKQ
ncbi:hypothetical protein CHS0354_026403 [Potamilus streckersoni]|uniref:Mitochondria-eating protein C-terminal domain-containing protein n=1 Tax=Potamilus streckersoni TaxID=2493646 RepID=A0AAE0T318_9BIVA|nr:hypothetical protein CHS0354_026403 [Potamilus streckersoni]